MYFTEAQLAKALKRGRIFNHFKGNQYMLLHYASDHTNINGEVIHKVVYANLIPTDDSIFVRDIDEFFSPTDMEKYPDATQHMRFEVADEIDREAIDAYC